MIKQHILGGCLFCYIILFGCVNHGSDRNSNVGEKFDTVELENFKFNSLKLITHKNLLVKNFGKPDRESKILIKSDSLHTLFFFRGDTNFAFEQRRDTVYFSYIEFGDSSNFVLKNVYGSFSKQTEFDAFRVLFNNSLNNAVLYDNVKKKVLALKVADRDKSWIRLEFKDDKLHKIILDTPKPALPNL